MAFAIRLILRPSKTPNSSTSPSFGAALTDSIHGEMDRISQCLTRRVRELVERYETPLPEAAVNVADLEKKVNAHLEKMGFSWA